MRSLRMNGTNAHDIQVQNNVDIYKRLISNRKRRSRHHNFQVFLRGRTVRLVALSLKPKPNIVTLIAQLYNWSFFERSYELA